MPKPFLTYEQQLVKLRDEKCIVIENESMTLNGVNHPKESR